MRRYVLLLIAVVAMGILLVLLLQPDLAKNLKTFLWASDLQQIAAFLRSKGWYGVIISMVIIILTTLLPLVPFIIFAGANALVFGLLPGFLVSWSSAVTGCVAAYWLARVLGSDFFASRLVRYSVVHKFQTSRHAFGLIFSLRLIPIFPSSVVNYGAGISPVSFRAFFWATLLGKIPIIAWESMLSYDLLNPARNLTRLILLLLLTAVFLVLVWKLLADRI